MPAALHTPAGWPPWVVDPLFDAALAAARVGRPFAISGVQGSGKSTLARQIAERAASAGLRAAVLSLDDVYLDRPAREHLGRDVHPLLATRGPPGTHDVDLACEVIDRTMAGGTVRLPRFDKATDRRSPESHWPMVSTVDLMLLEGWCLRVPAQAAGELRDPVNALEADEDPGGTWRRYCNGALAGDYRALWERLPFLAVLQAPSFEVVPDWRWQQECGLHAAAPCSTKMTRSGIQRFVQVFERLSRHALAVLPPLAGCVVRLDEDRRPLSVEAGGAGLPTMPA